MDARYTLTEEEILKFHSMGTIKEYDAGAILFYENTEAHHFYILLEGLVKGGRFEGKKENIFHFFFPFMMVGEVSFVEQKHYPLTTIFVTKAKVLVLNKNALLAEKNIAYFNSIFMRSIIGKVRYLQNSINTLASTDAKMKVAVFISEHRLWISHISIKEMATVLNLTRETVSRSISFFIQQKALRKNGKKIELVNVKHIENYMNAH